MRIGRRLLVAAFLGLLLGAAATTTHAVGSSNACPAGTKRAVIGGKAKCLKAGQRCNARYQAAYKRAGFTCVSGRLRKRTKPTPQPPPTPPPAQPGHYRGTTSQLETIDLDVRSDGRAVLNVKTGQINQGCTPPGHISGGGIGNGSSLISNDGNFTIDFPYQGSFSDGVPYSGRINLTGRFSGANVAGTLTATLNFTISGTAYACGSGQQTWTATRTG